MGLLVFGIFMLLALLGYLYLMAKAIRRKTEAPAVQVPKDNGMYRIHFDRGHWYDPMAALVKELPKLKPEVARWELYIEKKAGRDYLIINHLDSVTGKVVNVASEDLTRRSYGRDWQSLNGCGSEFQNTRVRESIVLPILERVDRMLEHGTIHGDVKQPPSNYTLL